MKKLSILIVAMTLSFSFVSAQGKLFTKQGQISFSSDTPMEKIEAVNNKVTAVMDADSGAIQFAVLVRAFTFEKALMQEHFNENYLESEKFPKATFKGTIVNLDQINLSKDGTYTADVSGEMTIHGVTKNVDASGNFVVENGSVSANSVFVIEVADYDIEIPKMVRENIAKEVEITVGLGLNPLESKGSASK